MVACLIRGHLFPPGDALEALLDFALRKRLKAASDTAVVT